MPATSKPPCNRDAVYFFLRRQRGKPARRTAPLKPKIDYLRVVGADFVTTQLLLETGAYLYASTGAKVVAVPHALNPEAFSPTTPNADRPIDIGMRTFRYPATFLGDDDCNRLIDVFSANALSPPLTVDIATDKRLDRAGWGVLPQSLWPTPYANGWAGSG